MKKAEMMDKYLDSYGKKISSAEICHVVDLIFKINLDKVPILSKAMEEADVVSSSAGNALISRELIDSHLNQYASEITGTEIRKIINKIFGVNLEGISSLEGARISLYSKGQWIVQHEKDLFVVHTGVRDVDVKVFSTNYFTEQTGLVELPTDLQHALTSLGYYFDEKMDSYYFSNPTGEAVPDAFKGKTMGAILGVIQHSFSDL
ncbi:MULTISPECIES: hypothetical protein [unclassified Lysinibacillus]|uniref:hypothetical protein n=1 Tax=unclassified Lysinibacillus TaxID=2636778 RepID=UPI0025549010|nr:MULTISPECIES: hypothetical protein [unclassified Lysinibacillus]MDM5250997.1 hypothetical protein [Lysinibacillus sp. G4S2]